MGKLTFRKLSNPEVARMLQEEGLGAGSMWSQYCTVTLVAEQDGQRVGFVSIAPKGEEGSGHCTIFGIYVTKPFRRQGYSPKIFGEGVRYCFEELKAPYVYTEILSGYLDRMIDKHFADRISEGDEPEDGKIWVVRRRSGYAMHDLMNSL